MAQKGEGAVGPSSRIGLVGQTIALENRSSRASSVLTPSLARIADKDVEVELRGLSQPLFKVGGKLGNIVTSSSLSQIHRGWRIIAVNGQRLAAEEVSKALAAAQKMAKYTVTFGLEDEAKSDLPNGDRLDKERKERERFDNERLEKARLEKERSEKERLEKERLDKERLEKERLEKERRDEQEKERLAKARDEERKQEAEKRAAREVAEKSLEQSTGLPPRETVQEPQRALLAALAPVTRSPTPEAKPKGPCDKCDGPHATDDCPHFKKPRDDHKDAYENYQKTQKTGSEKIEEVKLSSASCRVLPQPGDGSCLFHSMNHGLKGSGASALRAEIADYIAAHPSEEVAGNPVSDWVLWDSGEDPASYARSMRAGSRWGGAMEIALCAKLRHAFIEIFERRPDHFVRIASFGDSRAANRIRLLYGGRIHYDAIETR